MTEYLLVIPIEPMDRSTYASAGHQLPLHCTLMPWFTLEPELHLADLEQEIRKISGQQRFFGIELVSETRELFGPNRDIPAHSLEYNSQLREMHNALLEQLDEMNSLPNEAKWVGEGFRPHVTDTAWSSFPPGSRHSHAYLCLIERCANGNKEVVATFFLG